MAVDPIEARCDRCGDDFHLFELLDDRSGTCPRCRRTLTLDWTAKLLEDAERADIAQRQLIGALRSLRNLPGNLSVRPHVILRNLFEEVGWQKDLAGDPEMLREELRELRRLLIAWELLDPVVAAAQPHRGWFSRAVDVLTGRPPEPVVSVPGGHDALSELDPTAEAPTDPGDRQAEKVPVAS